MAPEIALEIIKNLRPKSIVLDPMSGSGTVLRQASYAGLKAIGFDMDPLAVLMSKVATTNFNISKLEKLSTYVAERLGELDSRKVYLPWIDDDIETQEFIKYWFANRQQEALRKISFLFNSDRRLKRYPAELDILRLAMSRLIITKERKASLARDTSHSRPHKVANKNDFDVIKGLTISTKQLGILLSQYKLCGEVKVKIGDARNLHEIKNGSIDAIITSPPYLNAIDYLRGHKLSLIWFGYKISDIRRIRSASIGAEKSPDNETNQEVQEIAASAARLSRISTRYQKMILRYAGDINKFFCESVRVLKRDGKAVLVIGNSCIQHNFINNSTVLKTAATFHGLSLISEYKRDLPNASRYLPLPADQTNSLAKRMRTESVLTFQKSR